MAEQDVMRILGVLAAAFPNNKIAKETLDVYKLTLADIPADVLENATLQIITTAKFFPSVSEIRDTAHSIILGLNKIPSQYEAWEEVQNVIARCGDYYHYQVAEQFPSYSHPLVEQAVEVMGYRSLCESDNMVADRAHFFKVYESLFSRAVDDMKMLPRVKDFSEKYQLLGSKFKLLADKMNVNKGA
jgi:hypothetical protein